MLAFLVLSCISSFLLYIIAHIVLLACYYRAYCPSCLLLSCILSFLLDIIVHIVLLACYYRAYCPSCLLLSRILSLLLVVIVHIVLLACYYRAYCPSRLFLSCRLALYRTYCPSCLFLSYRLAQSIYLLCAPASPTPHPSLSLCWFRDFFSHLSLFDAFQNQFRAKIMYLVEQENAVNSSFAPLRIASSAFRFLK
jgi:hypothetical protein